MNNSENNEVYESLNKIEHSLLNNKNLHSTSEITQIYKKLKSIIKLTIDSRNVTLIRRILNLSIKCAVICHLRQEIRNIGYFMKKRNFTLAKKSMNMYKKIILNLHVENYDNIVSTIIKTFDDEKYWKFTTICVNLLTNLLINETLSLKCLNILLDLAKERVTEYRSVETAECMVLIISQMTESTKWPFSNQNMTYKILNIHDTIVMSQNSCPNYMQLQDGIELSIKHILNKTTLKDLQGIMEQKLEAFFPSQLSNSKVEYFGRIIDYASVLINIELWKIENTNVIVKVLLLISSTNELYTVLGTNIFQHLTDSLKNYNYLDEPMLFFGDIIHYQLKVKDFVVNQKNFIKTFRVEVYFAFFNAVQNHSNSILHLKAVYRCLMILMLEIPCDYTAVVVVTLLMNIQSFALRDQTLSLETKHRLHALVISLFSSICWIMKPKILSAYVITIQNLRAHHAPFLNPPLKDKYQYAKHFVLWPNPEFFFDEREVRYALWQRFRMPEKEIKFNVAK